MLRPVRTIMASEMGFRHEECGNYLDDRNATRQLMDGRVKLERHIGGNNAIETGRASECLSSRDICSLCRR
jgi:hypothetical protein